MSEEFEITFTNPVYPGKVVERCRGRAEDLCRNRNLVGLWKATRIRGTQRLQVLRPHPSSTKSVRPTSTGELDWVTLLFMLFHAYNYHRKGKQLIMGLGG